MNRIVLALVAVLAFTNCRSMPTQLVYSGGFSFANYDYVVVAKSDGKDTATSLYGMDVEFANLMSRYNMKVVGDKEYQGLSEGMKKRTLAARMSITASNNWLLLSVSFDDSVTGRTGASVTSQVKGSLFDVNHRTRAFEIASRVLIKALEKDKGLQITNANIRR